MNLGLGRNSGVRLRRDRSGAAAIEFAIVGATFIGLLLGLLMLAFDFYMQAAVDLALRNAVRQVQLGQVPATDTAGDFIANLFCPAFVAFAPCQNIAVTLQPVSDWYTPNVVATPDSAHIGDPGAFCIGQPGQLMFARVVFLAPAISSFWLFGIQGTVGGSTGTLLVSTAAFANENPSGTSIPAGSGC